MSALSGIVEYDPSELTITALAGTPVAEVGSVLAEHGQYLPFDPPLVAAGATIGGSVAAGASGAGALRHGRVRDFVIGVKFIDGAGRLVTGGGKVVKNAAGFDLPKLMVGSLGRLGVITQLSFKVFPRPAATATLRVSLGDTAQALALLERLWASPIELEALDIAPGGALLIRLGGRTETLDARILRLRATLGTEAARLDGDEEAELWKQAAEFAWMEQGSLVRVPLAIGQLNALDASIATADGARVRYSLGGTVAWINWPAETPLDRLQTLLNALGLRGLVLLGSGDHAVLGPGTGGAFGQRVRHALDPDSRFLEI
jgi:glycolate oxidase FAD binding subunit